MSVESEEFPVAPAPVNPSRNPVAGLPWTVYLWFGVIVASLLVPRLLARAGVALERPRVTREALTANEFERYVEAAQNVRVAFASAALQARLADKGLPTKDVLPAKQATESLNKARQQYGEMEKTSRVPSIPRVLLILDHAAGKPLNEKRLTGSLTAALQEAKKSPQEIHEELSLWRAMYRENAAPLSTPLNQQVALVRSFELHFLEKRALTDLYNAYDDTKQAKAAQKSLDADAMSFYVRLIIFGLGVFGGIAAGIGLLIWIARAAILRRWSEIGRLEQSALSPGYGTLVDAFACFFALLFTTRFVTGLFTTYALPNPTVGNVLAMAVIGYATPAMLALIYLYFTARARGATLAGIGLTGNHWGKNILYGVAGYCAVLPFTATLGLLARWIFKHNPDVTPNPILPLIVAERDFGGRFIIFLLVAVAAPLVEEIFFRGVLQTGLRERFGIKWAILLSAVFFAIGHPLQDWIPIFGLGVAFGAMRELRQSLVPSMVAHYIQNSLAFFALSSLFSN